MVTSLVTGFVGGLVTGVGACVNRVFVERGSWQIARIFYS